MPIGVAEEIHIGAADPVISIDSRRFERVLVHLVSFGLPSDSYGAIREDGARNLRAELRDVDRAN